MQKKSYESVEVQAIRAKSEYLNKSLLKDLNRQPKELETENFEALSELPR